MIEKKQGRRSAQDAQKTRYHIITIAAELFCELGYSRVSLDWRDVYKETEE